MLNIRNDQLLAFHKVAKTNFRKRLNDFLRKNFISFCREKTNDYLEAYTDEIIQLGEKYELIKESSYQKLVYARIQYEFDIPLIDILENQLTGGEMELAKVENLITVLKTDKNNLKHIIIDSNSDWLW